MTLGHTYIIYHHPSLLSLLLFCLTSKLKVLGRRDCASLLHLLPSAPLGLWSPSPPPQPLIPTAGTSDEQPGGQPHQGIKPLKNKSLVLSVEFSAESVPWPHSLCGYRNANGGTRALAGPSAQEPGEGPRADRPCQQHSSFSQIKVSLQQWP